MAFRFPLASVLGFRESVERREELALARVQLEMARVQHEIERVTEDLAEAQRKREECMRKAIPAAEVQSMLRAAGIAGGSRTPARRTKASLPVGASRAPGTERSARAAVGDVGTKASPRTAE